MKTLTPSIMELTDNFSIETNSKDLSISHEIINDELKLKITSNYSQIPSRIKLISSNRSNLKIIADINLNENATLEIIDENDIKGKELEIKLYEARRKIEKETLKNRVFILMFFIVLGTIEYFVSN